MFLKNFIYPCKNVKNIIMQKNKNKKSIFFIVFLGAIIGFINGVFGGGGGMIVVPVLTNYFDYDDKTAHATALTIILPLSIISAVIYFFNNSIMWNTVITAGSGFLIGGIMGSLLLNKINNRAIRIFFSFVMIICGIIQITK